jgi:hypothetical protein
LFGALYVLTVCVPIATTQAMTAGPLIRRHGPRLAVLLPYFEVTFPATVLITFAFSAWVNLYFNDPPRIWHLLMFGLLVLALTATLRGWPWPVRLLLHAGWLFSAAMAGVQL